MSTTLNIGLIGDQSTAVRAHAAIPETMATISTMIGVRIQPRWLPTDAILGNEARTLEEQGGLWCVPGSPYRSMVGALAAIRFAREHGVPFLGTCGGFQHTVIEFARHVMGITNADHAESNPQAQTAIITPLACPLVGRTGLVRLTAGSRAAACYGTSESTEKFHCNFALNPTYAVAIDRAGLRVTGVDEQGETRIIELPSHPFFMATLFQPELSSTPHRPHPLIVAFIQAVISATAAARA